MKHSTVYLHAIVVVLALETFPLEVEGLQSTILTSCEEPLVVLLEVHRYNIASMSFERPLLVWVSQIIYLHMSNGTCSKILFVLTQHQSINSIISKLFGFLTLAILYVPELYLLIITRCRQNNI